MTKLLMMAAAFLILTGIAMLIKRALRMKLGEGFFLAVSLVIVSLYLSGRLFVSFRYGMYFLIVCGIGGFLLDGFLTVREGGAGGKAGRAGIGKICAEAVSLPAFGILLLMFLYGAVFFYGAFLQNPDDLHWYGPVLLNMAKGDRLIDWSKFIVLSQPYAASFFGLFFVKLAGTQEQVMYAAAFFMNWAAFMLPMAGMKGKDWRRVLMYGLIIFAALYSLYSHPYKSLYVDLPCAAWAGGIAGWWPVRDRGRKAANLVLLAAGLVTLVFLKQMIGPLMALLTIAFVWYENMAERCSLDADRGKKRAARIAAGTFVLVIVLCAAAGVCLLILDRNKDLFFLPEIIVKHAVWTEFSLQKVVRVTGALGNAVLGTALHGKSHLKVYTFAFLLFLLFWQTVTGWFDSSENYSSGTKVRNVYFVTAAFGYIIALVLAYSIEFTYGEAVKAKSAKRYLSILVIYLLLICLAGWIRQEVRDIKRKRIHIAVSMAVLLLFVSGWNDRFISNATALNSYQVKNIEDITNTRTQAQKILGMIGPEDKVFFINQDDSNEMPQNTALCYLQGQVSNFLLEPWRFTENGCEIREAEADTPTVADLPEILKQGGYDYVWVYKTDGYLKDSMQSLFDVNVSKREMDDGQLFRIVYGEDRAGLELESELAAGAAKTDS